MSTRATYLLTSAHDDIVACERGMHYAHGSEYLIRTSTPLPWAKRQTEYTDENQLSTLIISSCIACTDPLLSQSIAKGPFSDTYVRRPLREFISAEAGLNDGFGFPFLLLAVSLLRYAETPENAFSLEQFDLERGVPGYLDSVGKGRFGGGGVVALEHWVLEGVGYMILLGGAVGWLLGILGRWGVGFGVKR